MGANVMEENGFFFLKDLKLEIKGQEEDGFFCFCFWVYVLNLTSFPSVLLHQVHPDTTGSVPFLVLNEKKKLMLSPLHFRHHEAPSPGYSWLMENTCASAKIEFPMKKWVHVGCEVSVDFVRFHINGLIVGEKSLSSTLNNGSHSHGSRELSLACTPGEADKNHEIHGYVHGVEVLPPTPSIKYYYLKDPPLQLSIDSSSASDIEEDNDGVWRIVGGKASCRRNFSLDVILLDAVGQPVNKELEVVATLLYADSDTPAEKPNDAEAPLLTSYDGIEFASWDRPSKLISGRASFKLKISQLSSKFDNKLFRIRFDIPKLGRYPFLETFSHPIRCISRNRNTRTSSFMWKNSISPMHLLTGFQSFDMDEGSSDVRQNIVSEEKQSPSSKRVKLGQEKQFAMFKVGISLEQVNKEFNSPAWKTNEDDNAYGTSLGRRSENHVETDNSSPDSESSEATISISQSMLNNRNPVSDSTVFKYCLGSLTERALLLKEIAMSSSEQELTDFAEQVSLYSGCFHHRHQIIIAKRLIEDGVKAWNSISENNHHVLWENMVSEIERAVQENFLLQYQIFVCGENNHHVLWENMVSEIEEQFKKIYCCSTRYLSAEDLEVMRKIAGCHELVARENFEKLWCWLYPVAFTLSQEWVNALWDSVLLKWIEGLVTKEEAEYSLQGPGGLQGPGTFVLRFPASRSWPHPDAGNLVVTYVGTDYTIHHRLLSLDFIYSSAAKEKTLKPLKEMLLEEPELSRLGRQDTLTLFFLCSLLICMLILNVLKKCPVSERKLMPLG